MASEWLLHSKNKIQSQNHTKKSKIHSKFKNDNLTHIENQFASMSSQPQVSFGRNSSSQELDRVQERADKTVAELRRTQAELRVTQVSTFVSSQIYVDSHKKSHIKQIETLELTSLNINLFFKLFLLILTVSMDMRCNKTFFYFIFTH